MADTIVIQLLEYFMFTVQIIMSVKVKSLYKGKTNFKHVAETIQRNAFSVLCELPFLIQKLNYGGKHVNLSCDGSFVKDLRTLKWMFTQTQPQQLSRLQLKENIPASFRCTPKELSFLSSSVMYFFRYLLYFYIFLNHIGK